MEETKREIDLRKKREWHVAHRDEQNRKRREWHAAHREEAKQKMRDWYHAHKEQEKPKHREWHHTNKEIANPKRLKRYYENHEEQKMKKRESFQKKRISAPWNRLVWGAMKRAQKKNVPFSLTQEWAEERWTGYCEVSGIPFRLGQRGSSPKFYSPSIDRIIPSEGYTPENCRFVLWAVNSLKHDGTDQDMLFVAGEVLKNYPYKTIT